MTSQSHREDCPEEEQPFSSSETSALVSESIFYHPAFVLLVRSLAILLGRIDIDVMSGSVSMLIY